MGNMTLFGEDLVTRTKFIAPRLKGAHIPRERLHALLAGACAVPLTVIMGGAGYGKSTVLAGFLEATGTPGLWYELGERDADPQVLGLHLAHLLERAFPGSGEKALAILARPGGASVHGPATAEALCDALLDRLVGDTLLVLDDFEVLERASDTLSLLNHLIEHLPPRLHVALASRTRPALPHFARWRLEGDVLTIDQDALAFDAAEAQALFERLGADLQDAARLVEETAGWPMAVQLLARRAGAGDNAALLADPEARRDLFEYLAREVLDVLPAGEREFLLATAPLARLDAGICEALTGRGDAGTVLQQLADRGILLVAPPDDALRPHHLFRDFMLARLAEAGRLAPGHQAAADALRTVGRDAEAVDHLIAAGNPAAAAERILALGPELVRQGLFETVAVWIRRLPDALLDATPELAKLQGDASRLAARFDAALGWYDRALAAQDADPGGRSRTLAAKAQVFLDTVRPALAAALLEEAARLAAEPAEKAKLQVLLAENALNQGDPIRAAALLDEAGAKAPDAAEVRGRMLLRTGKLREARDWLRALLDREGDQAVKAHREAALVLSLVEAFLGDAKAARDLAERGLARARHQGAAWGEAVGLIRAGHAALVAGVEREAGAMYRKALDIADAVGVDRLTSEPLAGLTVLAGRRGDLGEAERHAQRALDAARKHGDRWMGALVQLALAAAFCDAADPRARAQCEQAAGAFAAVADAHGEARALLLGARAALAPGDGRQTASRLGALATRLRDSGLGSLLAGPTLLGFANHAQAVDFMRQALDAGLPAPVLIAALRAGTPPDRLAPLLEMLGLEGAQAGPRQDALRVRTLGPFRVWRGGQEVDRKTWGRKIALQLFHLLVVHRGDLLPKSRIIDMLWPDLDPGVADGTFRVALNALNKALEPERQSGQEPRHIARQGTAYALRLGDDLTLDVVDFERLLDAAAVVEASGDDPGALAEEALALFDGDFLAEFTEYGDWCDRERERLAARFSDQAARHARRLLLGGNCEGCAGWAGRLLALDPCAEQAYRLLMAAQYRLGDRTGALRTYERCAETLERELAVAPMPETELVRQAILDQQPIEGLAI